MLRAVDAALVVTDERIRRFLGPAVQVAAPRLGCVTASSLGGMNLAEVAVASRQRGIDPVLLGHNAVIPSRSR